ncbi:hypothetical protein [Endozoicomonas elysicola]|nr:hypothetical protein [Endozoicomonas elysicola]
MDFSVLSPGLCHQLSDKYQDYKGQGVLYGIDGKSEKVVISHTGKKFTKKTGFLLDYFRYHSVDISSRYVREQDVENFLARVQAPSEPLAQLTRPDTLTIIEGGLKSVLGNKTGSDKRVLILPCSNALNWHNRTGKALETASALLKDCEFDLSQMLDQAGRGMPEKLNQVILLNLPENRLKIETVILFPLDEKVTTTESLNDQYLHAAAKLNPKVRQEGNLHHM